MYDYDYSVPIPPQRRDSLSKATRDLMALEQPIKRPPPPALNPPPNPESPANHVKPTLSPSQKKANHIQSEQKRRANIRRGYEALCDAVPSLREALSNPPSSSSSSFITEPRKRRRTGNEDKLDGRAGPKSENVVLGKTIEYIHGLLAETEALKARLAAVEPPRAREDNQPRLWERKWDGGHSKRLADEDDGDEESDE